MPAKPIKPRFEQDIINRLQKVRWWDFPEKIIKDNICLLNAKVTDVTLSELEKIKNNL